MSGPPQNVIDDACAAARRSPCVKSKRGAVLFHPQKGIATHAMWNSRPDNKCDLSCQPLPTENLLGRPRKTEMSPSRCSMLCVHAEERAIRVAGYVSERSQLVADGDFAFVLQEMELVHVKVNDRGLLVPSGGPSCWSCAKTVADTGIFGVWLYLADEGPRGEAIDVWRFYTNKEFYNLTLEACHLARREQTYS